MSRAASASVSTETRARVGYVMTHYPKIAQTFIANEIEAVERAGLAITCFAMNSPTAHDRDAPGAQARVERTIYLKASPLRAAIALVAQTLRHPVGLARVWLMALKSAGGGPARSLRRIAHLAQAARVAHLANREGIERIHAHFGLAPATIAWLATAIAHAHGRRRAAFSFTIHGFHDFVDPAESRLDLKSRDAAAVLCISDFTRSQLCLGTDPSLWPRFHVARCGIDTAAFAYRDPPPLSEAPTLLALGRLSPEKGFAVLIEAVARLHQDNVPATLRIVGDGPIRGDLERWARHCGVAHAVTFTGELPALQVREELNAADIFCMASFSEGLPISLMEAMAVGVPVVSTWIAGIPELAQDNVNAVTVPPANAEAFAGAVKRLAQDESLRRRLARAARGRIEADHDMWRCGTRVAALLKGQEP